MNNNLVSSTNGTVPARPPGAEFPYEGDILKDSDNSSGTLGLSVGSAQGSRWLQVSSITLGGPADIEGTLEAGDLVLAVDGGEVSEDNFVQRFRGPDCLGSKSTIRVEVEEEATKEALRFSLFMDGEHVAYYSHRQILFRLPYGLPVCCFYFRPKCVPNVRSSAVECLVPWNISPE